MALSPSIPTSFVPKQPVATDGRRFSTGGNNVLLIVALIVFGLTIVIAAGTFLYDQFLKSEANAKGAEVIAAQKSVDEDAVNQLIRLQSRLSAAESIISQHVALTQFFSLLSSITVQDVHFDGVSIIVNDDRSATITMTGEAKDFNALAAESNVFASQPNIKSAIFSNILVKSNSNEVSFALNANLSPALVIESAPPTTGVASVTAATSTTGVAPTTSP